MLGVLQSIMLAFRDFMRRTDGETRQLDNTTNERATLTSTAADRPATHTANTFTGYVCVLLATFVEGTGVSSGAGKGGGGGGQTAEVCDTSSTADTPAWASKSAGKVEHKF